MPLASTSKSCRAFFCSACLRHHQPIQTDGTYTVVCTYSSSRATQELDNFLYSVSVFGPFYLIGLAFTPVKASKHHLHGRTMATDATPQVPADETATPGLRVSQSSSPPLPFTRSALPAHCPLHTAPRCPRRRPVANVLNARPLGYRNSRWQHRRPRL